MNYVTQNGWTKERMKKQILENMLDHPSRTSDREACLYRAADGNKCAAGCFILDEQIPKILNDCKTTKTTLLREETIEGTSVCALMNGSRTMRDLMPLTDKGMRAMQRCHDETEAAFDPRPRLLDWIDENVAEDKGIMTEGA